MNEHKIKVILSIIVSALLISTLLFILVVATGNTFGQRAAETYEWGTPEWEEEVQRLYNE